MSTSWRQLILTVYQCYLPVITIRSFTTFSTFSFDVVTWLSEGRTARAFAYVATNNVCSIAAAGVGMMVVKKILAKA